jgi:hypothetical protein
MKLGSLAASQEREAGANERGEHGEFIEGSGSARGSGGVGRWGRSASELWRSWLEVEDAWVAWPVVSFFFNLFIFPFSVLFLAIVLGLQICKNPSTASGHYGALFQSKQNTRIYIFTDLQILG